MKGIDWHKLFRSYTGAYGFQVKSADINYMDYQEHFTELIINNIVIILT
jgi:hypothetical protein